MAERPDLDAIEADMQVPTFYGSARAMVKLQSLLTYCRELEAENKRLRTDIDEMSFTPEPKTWRSGPGWKPKT